MLNELTVGERTSAPAVTITPVSQREQWEHLFGQLAAPHFTQAWCYGEGKRTQGWSAERLVLRTEQTVALCQVLVRRVMGLPVVARINRGPLFVERAPSPEMQLAILSALRRRWRFARRGLLLIAPALPFEDASATLLREAGFIQRRAGGWGSSLVALEPSLEEIRANLTSKWRNTLNRAIKAGVEVRFRKDAEGFEWMLERHIKNMTEKNFVGPSVGFVRAMLAASPDSFWLFQANHDNEPVCGAMGTSYGAHSENFISWTNDAGRRLGAHNLLIWNAIVEMKAAGHRVMDLGGFTTSEKYGAYKRGMRGREYRLCGEWLAI